MARHRDSHSAHPAKARVREARAAMYRELILDAAEGVFAELGYDATRVQQIAEQAGVSLATIYSVFPGKEQLFRAIHRRREEELLAASLTGLDLAGASPVDLVLHGTAASARFHMEHPDYLRMSLRQGHAWAVGANPHASAELDIWRRGVTMMGAVFQRGVAEGLFVDDDPPEVMARTLMALHQVRLAAWAEAGGAEPVDDAIRHMHRQLLRVFCPPEVAAAYLAPSPTPAEDSPT